MQRLLDGDRQLLAVARRQRAAVDADQRADVGKRREVRADRDLGNATLPCDCDSTSARMWRRRSSLASPRPSRRLSFAVFMTFVFQA